MSFNNGFVRQRMFLLIWVQKLQFRVKTSHQQQSSYGFPVSLRLFYQLCSLPFSKIFYEWAFGVRDQVCGFHSCLCHWPDGSFYLICITQSPFLNWGAMVIVTLFVQAHWGPLKKSASLETVMMKNIVNLHERIKSLKIPSPMIQVDLLFKYLTS